jgi:pilus assembly protein CpaF
MSAPIVVLVNAKGGSGATTLAVEAARSIRRGGNSVALVDADLSGRRNVAILLDAIRTFDANRSLGIYSIAEIGGLTAVELTDSLDNAFALRPDEIDALVDKLVQRQDLVLVDTPTPFSGAIRPFIARASRVLVVLEPNLLGSAAARSLVAELAKFGVPLARIGIVTNLRGGRAEISARELEKALGTSTFGEIPMRSDRGFGRAIDGFAKKVASTPAETPIASLRPSPSASNGAALKPSNGAASGNGAATPEIKPAGASNDLRDKLKAEVHEQISKRIDVVAASRAHTDGQKFAELRSQISEITNQFLSERPESVSGEERAELQQEVIDELLGLGPLEDLMRDPAVSEIMVNGGQTIYVERNGKLSLSDRHFADERHLRTIIERIIAPLGRRIDESSPMVDARLPDGSRVNAVIEPISLEGSTLTIRRFGKRRLTMDDLVRFGSVSQEVVGLLKAIVESRLNVLVSGGTGSGKTTFLNILSNFIPNNERIVTIEDAAELKLVQDHVVRLEARPPNIEGRGSISIRDLVKNSLRMRPDRIVVGECRSGEALDMLQAMNTGHDGSMTTLHANTPRDAIARLETLVLMAGFELPVRAIREQIASAINVVVQTERVRDGSRKITSIAEVVGMEGDIVTMQELVVFKQAGVDNDGKVLGHFQFTGVQPHYMSRFDEAGVHFDFRELTKLIPARAVW